jgi:raffinose/stachyose/melibiose transport system substrate-binding protein
MKRFLSLVMAVVLMVSLLSITASAEGKFQSHKIKIVSIWDETDPASNGYIINELAKQYAETVEGFSLDYEYVSITEIDQKVTTLMASNDLPELCIYESGTRLKDVIASGQILDLDAALTELGVRDYVDEGAASLLIGLVDGLGLYDLPLGLNVEGFWYNKAVFTAAGLDPENPPQTWDELLAACEAIKAIGIAPIAQGGADQWPMTRVLNAYLVRSVGLDAVKNAMDGTAKWTDDNYVAAAQMFQDLATKGYFVQGMNTVDYTTAVNMVMSGQAGMQYNGSWVTSNLDSADNQAGENGIGFFNVPLVNDSSTLGDYSMNCGNILMVSAAKYDAAVGDFLKYLVTHTGDFAMTNQASFKGFKIDNMPADLPVYTQIVGNALSTASGAFLWFEAKMDSETSTLAQNNIALLYTGEMTAAEYMQALQDSTDKNMK